MHRISSNRFLQISIFYEALQLLPILKCLIGLLFSTLSDLFARDAVRPMLKEIYNSYRARLVLLWTRRGQFGKSKLAWLSLPHHSISFEFVPSMLCGMLLTVPSWRWCNRSWTFTQGSIFVWPEYCALDFQTFSSSWTPECSQNTSGFLRTLGRSVVTVATAVVLIPAKGPHTRPVNSSLSVNKSVSNSVGLSVFCITFVQTLHAILVCSRLLASPTAPTSIFQTCSCSSWRQAFILNYFCWRPKKRAISLTKTVFHGNSTWTRTINSDGEETRCL